MKIIISPAKKMVEDTDSFDISKLPIFKDKAEVLLTWLKSKNYDELKNIWKCNDKIAKLNYDRVQDMNLDENSTVLIFSTEGNTDPKGYDEIVYDGRNYSPFV